MRLDLDSQGEFVALISAIQMQLESGNPVARVVRLLADALVELATARGVSVDKLRLEDKLATVLERLQSPAHRTAGR